MKWLLNVGKTTLPLILFDEFGRSEPFAARKVTDYPDPSTLALQDNWAMVAERFASNVPAELIHSDLLDLWVCFPKEGDQHTFSLFTTRAAAREFQKNSSYPVGAPELVWVWRYTPDVGSPCTVVYAEDHTEVIHPRLGHLALLTKKDYGFKVTFRGGRVSRPYRYRDSADIIRQILMPYHQPDTPVKAKTASY